MINETNWQTKQISSFGRYFSFYKKRIILNLLLFILEVNKNKTLFVSYLKTMQILKSWFIFSSKLMTMERNHFRKKNCINKVCEFRFIRKQQMRQCKKCDFEYVTIYSELTKVVAIFPSLSQRFKVYR